MRTRRLPIMRFLLPLLLTLGLAVTPAVIIEALKERSPRGRTTELSLLGAAWLVMFLYLWAYA